jgi:hypothetical protein
MPWLLLFLLSLLFPPGAVKFSVLLISALMLLFSLAGFLAALISTPAGGKESSRD